MNIFDTLLKEAVDGLDDKAFTSDELDTTLNADVDDTDESSTVDIEDDTEEVSGIVKDTQDLIVSILDALEQEALAQGETISEDDSPDIALELLYKFIPTMPTEQVQTIYDELSEYYEMDVDDENEDYFEEPEKTIDDLDYEEDVKSESLQVKKKL